MAKESRVSDEAWRAARLRWERGEASIQQVADSIGVSKALVMKRKASEGWQLGIGVAAVTNKGPSGERSNFTESAVGSGTRAGMVTGHHGESRVPAVAPAGDTMPTPTPDSWAFKVAEPPADLTPMMRRDWIRRECEILAQRVGARHELELRSLQNAFATEMTKGDAKERGPALRLKALTEAIEKRHAMQRAGLIDFTKQRMGEFAGMPSPGIVFVVHVVPGMRFDRGAPEPVAGTKLVEVGSYADVLDVISRGDVVDLESKEVI